MLGLGNPILSDDGFGLVVVERLRGRAPEGVDVIGTEVAGLRLLELMRGYRNVVLVDALSTGQSQPGTIVRFEGRDFRGGQRWSAAHSIGIGTVLDLGRGLGYDMPTQVVAYAVEAQDVETFGEQLSPAVAEAVDEVMELVIREVGGRWEAA